MKQTAIVRFLFICFVMCLFITGCNNERKHLCIYQGFNALHQHRYARDTLYLKITDELNNVQINYVNTKNDTTAAFIFFGETNEMIEVDYGQIDHLECIFMDKKIFTVNGEKIGIYAYHTVYKNLMTASISRYFNREYGFVLTKSGNYVRPLCVFDGDTVMVQRLVRAIKKDSSFYNLRLLSPTPPSLN